MSISPGRWSRPLICDFGNVARASRVKWIYWEVNNAILGQVTTHLPVVVLWQFFTTSHTPDIHVPSSQLSCSCLFPSYYKSWHSLVFLKDVWKKTLKTKQLKRSIIIIVLIWDCLLPLPKTCDLFSVFRLWYTGRSDRTGRAVNREGVGWEGCHFHSVILPIHFNV